MKSHLFILVFFCLPFSLPLLGQNEHLETRKTDSLELIKMYKNLNGEEWLIKWDLEKPMNTWFGISVNSKGRVVCIDLDGKPDCQSLKHKGNGLKGILPDLQLGKLQRLYLMGNEIESQLPNFSGMPNLEVLNLSCNKLSGFIPDFQYLPKVSSLELDYNDLEGEIPSFSAMKNLYNLYLSYNKLSGEIPNFTNSKLVNVLLHKNKLSGKIPNFSHSKKLKKLILKNNELSGKFPSWGHLTKLEHIDASHNNIEGKINSLKKMRKLQYLNLAHNQLEGAIPNLKHQKKIRTLLLQYNKFTIIPEKIDKAKKLKELNVSNNSLPINGLIGLLGFFKDTNQYAFQQYPYEDVFINVELEEQTILELPNDMVHNGNIYEWFRNGEPLYKGKESILEFNAFSKEVEGAYSCKISNPLLEGFSIQSNRFVVTVLDTPISEEFPLRESIANEKTVRPDLNYLKELCLLSEDGLEDLVLSIFDNSGKLIDQVKGKGNICSYDFQNSSFPNNVLHFSLWSPSNAHFYKSGSFLLVN